MNETATGQFSGSWAAIRSLGQSLLEPMLGELARFGSGLHPPDLPVEIAESHAGTDARPDLRELDITERADWSAWSRHDQSPLRRPVVALALVVEPTESVGFCELQMTANLEGCRACPVLASRRSS